MIVGDELEERRARAQSLVARLSPRQLEVLREVAAGYRNKQIAHRIGIGAETVKMHRAAALAKLGVVTVAEAIRLIVEADV